MRIQLNQVFEESSLTGLYKLPAGIAHCCVTSPPYFGLRNYGHAEQLGLEPTPEEYIKNMVSVFNGVYHALKDNGTLWLNLGDSYWGGKGKSGSASSDKQAQRAKQGDTITQGHQSIGAKGYTRPTDAKHAAIKPKDLVGIPWRMAFALQGFAVVPMCSFTEWANILREAREKQDWEAVEFVETVLRSMDLLTALQQNGWYLRQDIIWHKPNPMPESVTDRCTKSHEYIFLLSKQPKYYYDSSAIRTPVRDSSVKRLIQQLDQQKGSNRVPNKTNGPMKPVFPSSWKGSSFDNGKTGEMKLTRGGTIGPGRNPAPHDNKGGNQGSSTGIKAYSHRGTGDKKLTGHSGNFDKEGNLIGNGMANKKSVWSVTTKPFKEAHFATFPRDLIRDCIKAGSPVNGIVIDPFMGARTTGIEARFLDRYYLGYEINHQYNLIGEKREIKEFGGLFNTQIFWEDGIIIK